MKKTLPLLLCLPLLLALTGDEGYNIKIRIKGLKDTVCFFGHYYADKQYVRDTARVDGSGNMVFSGKDALPGGIYLVVLPSKKYFEVIIDKQQHFSMETDTADLPGKMKVKNSDDNTLFYSYMAFINEKAKEVEPLKKKMEAAKNKDSVAYYQKQLAKVDEDVKNYKLSYIKDHPETFLAKVFKASQDPVVPKDLPKLPNGKPDSAFPFRYYKAHYFDNVDLSDDRLLRTPIVYNKIKYYLDKLTMQVPDSIIKEADMLIARTQGNKEMFKYLVYYCTYNYETSSIMGMDAVFVHMAEKYYMTGQAYWTDSATLAKITSKAVILKPLLIGKPAPKLTLPDTLGNMVPLYGVASKYTVLIFWDPDCGHCKKVVPKLKAFYDKYRSKNVKVYAVNIEGNHKEWKKYIRENKLDWINTCNVTEKSEHYYLLKQLYDVYSTPVIYLLDENKKIIAKRIDPDNLPDIIERHSKNLPGK
ncbi:MAG: thioredoxin-like domain-containing protein [Bacteroidota bacterium]